MSSLNDAKIFKSGGLISDKVISQFIALLENDHFLILVIFNGKCLCTNFYMLYHDFLLAFCTMWIILMFLSV